ncbi:MAG: dienelactone hydrolase family protein [Ignavibacteriae bacterium]|nr:dienelactone hydrolase family protein [Ignavibacteriota bacterium]
MNKKNQSTLVHIIQEPRKPVGEKYPTLILLHGRGADEHDLFGLAEYLDERLLVISARAPFQFSYGGGFTWYDILEVGRPEPKMFAESYRLLNHFFDDVKKQYPVDESNIFLLGFSMGTMMSYSLSLTRPNEIAGVIANSGYVPEETDLNFQWDKLHGTSFFVAHGTHDPIIPVSMGRRARLLFEQANADLTYKEYPMAHQISDESLSDMNLWLSEKLKVKSS